MVSELDKNLLNCMVEMCNRMTLSKGVVVRLPRGVVDVRFLSSPLPALLDEEERDIEVRQTPCRWYAYSALFIPEHGQQLLVFP